MDEYGAYINDTGVHETGANETPVNTIVNTGLEAAPELSAAGVLSWLLKHTSAQHFIVGYSGGVDSHVLLDLTAKAIALNPTLKVSALHIHHGLSPNADAWAKHCEKICSNYNIPLNILWVDAENYDGRSPEEVAREARFSAFEQCLKPGECLLLAHHAEDQAETILLRLFRGAGPQGLSGMSSSSLLGEGELLRPFLTISKQDIQKYAAANSLEWIEDESNHNCRFDRNFLRHEILPKLTARWPRVLRSVGRAGALCLETATAIQVLAKEDFQRVLGKSKDTLSVPLLLTLEPSRRRAVIRLWMQTLGSLPPSRDHMDRIEKEVLNAAPDRHPKLKLGEFELKRVKKELFLVKLGVKGKKRIKLL